MDMFSFQGERTCSRDGLARLTLHYHVCPHTSSQEVQAAGLSIPIYVVLPVTPPSPAT